LDRLVGRNYDSDIEAYLKRRLPLLTGRDRDYLLPYEAKLGWTRLHAAVDLGVIELVEKALQKANDSVDARSRDGRTALHLAAVNGKTALVEMLIKAKANPNIKDKKDQIAIQIAAQNDEPEIVRLLIADKSDVPDVFVAATAGATDRLATLVKENANSVKLKNKQGLTALHVAAREGHADSVKTLIAGGADVKAIDGYPDEGHTHGWTPLHMAAMAGKTPIVAILLDNGADVNAADKRGKHTPLHFAAWAGNADLVTLLLARKADRNLKDAENRTPLALAKEKGHKAVITLLEK